MKISTKSVSNSIAGICNAVMSAVIPSHNALVDRVQNLEGRLAKLENGGAAPKKAAPPAPVAESQPEPKAEKPAPAPKKRAARKPRAATKK